MKKKIFSTLLLVAFALASTSMFVSCKDYDDDFAKRDADIAALRAELEKRLADCKANCDAEHAKFLTQHQSLEGYAKLSDIPSLADYAKLSDIPSLDAYATWEALSALQAELANYVQAEAIQEALDYIASLQAKGITADGLTELMKKVNAIDESLATYAPKDYVDDKVGAAVEQLEEQIKALDLYEKALKEAKIEPDKVVELLKKIETIKTDVEKSYADDLTEDEVKTLRELIAKADELVNMEAGPDINIIQYLIDKTVASIILKPSSYVAGLATIEVPALYYQPIIKSWQNVKEDNNQIDEAYYYLEPTKGDLYKDLKWRYDDGPNAPGFTVPTWDEGFGWSDDYSGYDYRGEGSDKAGKLINDGEGTMLPSYRNMVGAFKKVKTAEFVPAAVATYHINPTTAKLNDYKLSFYTNTATVVDEIESRNSGYLNSMAPNDFAVPVDANAGNGEVNKFEKGVLEVPFKVSKWENYVEDLAYYFDGVAINQKKQSKVGVVRDSVNFIALQMTKGDTAVVTSDYAAVVPALIHINAVADNGPENRVLDCLSEKYYDGLWATKKNDYAGHMFKYAQQAVKADFTHTVAYNDTLDILPFVETHFTYIGANTMWSSYDQRMDAETFKKLGLKYVFSVVEYEDGKHATGESRHISIETKENAGADFGYDAVNLIPRSVKYNPSGISFADKYEQKVAGREAIDREPLIKVEVQNQNGDVYEVGYIKLLIVDNYYVKPITLQIDDPYIMNCVGEGGVKWSQIEEFLLHEIGLDGYTKQQFEAEYEIYTGTDYYNDHKAEFDKMLVDADKAIKDAEKADNKGAIDAAKKAKENLENLISQYKTTMDGKNAMRYIAIPDGDKFTYSADPYALGLVQYTEKIIDENDTEDRQTNVIKWNIGDEYARIAQAITGTTSAEAARDTLLKYEGKGKEPYKLTTTIRFVKKNLDVKEEFKAKYKDMSAIYVTLVIPAPQVQFAYGKVQKKDLSHWYELNSYKRGSEKDGTAIDILENVPTPAEVILQAKSLKMLETGQTGAPTFEFERPLYENFLNGIVTINVDTKKFNKYNYENNKNISFEFTLPVEGKNAKFSHNNKTWKVKGISGHEYTLKLADNYKAILDEHGCKIVEIIDKEGQPYIRMNDIDCANDILNYTGRYDSDGNDLTNAGNEAFYLNNGGDKGKETFTAYLKIKTNDPCYELLLDGRYFNAKFLRPINIWGKKDSKIDAKNDVQKILPTDLLTGKDWRNYALLLDKDLNGDANYADNTIGWDFYNIYAISTKYDEIYTDHAAEKSVRDNISDALEEGKLGLSKIFSSSFTSLNKVKEIPALNPNYLKVTALKKYDGQKVDNKQYNTAPQTCIEYTNNGGNVHDFHLFIPIYIQYAWGHGGSTTTKDGDVLPLNHLNSGNPNTLKVWTVVTIKKTEGSEASAKKN